MTLESRIIPLQVIDDAVTQKNGIKLSVLRLDLNHPSVSGNKLFKLKYNLEEAVKQNKKTILTFGGAFSNHIAATAAAGKEGGFKTIGIIRGEKHCDINPTLQFAMDCGMEIQYVSRTLYQNKTELEEYVKSIYSDNEFYLIPEGGSNELGIKGCTEISSFIKGNFDCICTPCGTGTTMTGIILSLKSHQKAIGFQVLKAENYIQKEIEQWLNKMNTKSFNWSINEAYHFGGYAKIKPELIDFIDRFEQDHGIPLDNIYTGKMMYGIYDLIKKGKFKRNETIIAVHTGGLQGNEGFRYLQTKTLMDGSTPLTTSTNNFS